jgi:hypothetical protein
VVQVVTIITSAACEVTWARERWVGGTFMFSAEILSLILPALQEENIT